MYIQPCTSVLAVLQNQHREYKGHKDNDCLLHMLTKGIVSIKQTTEMLPLLNLQYHKYTNHSQMTLHDDDVDAPWSWSVACSAPKQENHALPCFTDIAIVIFWVSSSA